MTYDIRRLAHPRKRLIVHYNRLKPFLQASPHGEQEPSEEEEEKGTPSEEQESRGEEINKEPQESMADLQDEQYIYVETSHDNRLSISGGDENVVETFFCCTFRIRWRKFSQSVRIQLSNSTWRNFCSRLVSHLNHF